MKKIKNYFKYWGKAEKDGIRYHLLPYHCLDVAAVGCLLFSPENKLNKKLGKQLDLSAEWLQKWMSFCFCLHDIGKFATAFQNLVPNMSSLLVPAKETIHYSERHDTLGYFLWKDFLREQLCNDNEDKSAMLRNVDPWIKIVTGHHGEPPKDNGRSRYQDYFTEADEIATRDYLNDIKDFILDDFDFNKLKDKSVRRKLKINSWIFAGAVVISDWFGSSREPENYLQKPINLNEYWINYALPFAKEVILNLEQAHSKISPYTGIQNLFPFITSPTPLQEWAEKCCLSENNQLIILEDVTGAGKTEAALVLAHRMMSVGAADGIYVALPTMATANAMYTRFAKAYRKLFSEESYPSLVLAHGASHLSDEFRKSIGISEKSTKVENYSEDDESADAFCSKWLSDNRKKALLAEIGVGTLDQALLGILPARYQSLRLFGLSKKVLIVDEVHAYDSYMNQLLQTLIEYHSCQGGNTILLSATLPKQMREQYVESFSKISGQVTRCLKEDKAYPLATYISEHECKEESVLTREEVKRSINVSMIDNFDHIGSIIKESVDNGKCVCWIRNTVKDARESFDFLEKMKITHGEKQTLFHSRFAMIDRQRIEKKTLKIFGKESSADQRKGQVLIATQVVEQSLDLDFDILITDLAPIDLIIQRAGRLHRHVRDSEGNPFKEEGAIDHRGKAHLYIYGPVPSKSPDKNWLKFKLPGTQAVYTHVGQIWLTQQSLLSGQVAMPEDGRQLIENVYSAESQQNIPDELQVFSGQAEGNDSSKRGMARLNALKLEIGYTRSSAENSGGWDKEVNIPTRLGDNSVTIAFARIDDNKIMPYAKASEFAWELSMIDIPRHDWVKIKHQIPQQHTELINQLKKEVKLLKWMEVVPLTGVIEKYYDEYMGWNPDKEDK